jgi:hypothetical protein
VKDGKGTFFYTGVDRSSFFTRGLFFNLDVMITPKSFFDISKMFLVFVLSSHSSPVLVLLLSQDFHPRPHHPPLADAASSSTQDSVIHVTKF